jgi:hypothetical protein
MAIDAGRLKHLELIQNVITRMANNSFLLKGWSVTILSAILAIAASKDGLHQIVWIGFLPAVMFWLLDGYFLRQERLYRKLWDRIRTGDQEAPTDFTMDTSAVDAAVYSLIRTCLTKTLYLFHGALVIVIILIVVLGHSKLS